MNGPARSRYEIVVVGAGIAGASLAYALAERGMNDVLVVERETKPAHHASGRSARTLLEVDPNPSVQRLKVLGARFLRRLPAGLLDRPVLQRNGAMRLYVDHEWPHVRAHAEAMRTDGIHLELLSPAEAAAVAPVLDPSRFAGGLLLPDDGFLDVPALLHAYLARASERGVELVCGVGVRGLERMPGRAWRITTEAGAIECGRIVNAAGAWAGELARKAGAVRIALEPRRRSIATFAVSPDLDVSSWPLVWSDAHRIYFRPGFGDGRGAQGDELLVCPMDEHAEAAGDAQPDEAALRYGMIRLAELAPGLRIGASSGMGLGEPLRRWAGLRTFAADGVPVVGEDPIVPEHFWLAGQGGCGIETSPILGAFAADLLTDGRSDLLDAAPLSPSRLPIVC